MEETNFLHCCTKEMASHSLMVPSMVNKNGNTQYYKQISLHMVVFVYQPIFFLSVGISIIMFIS